ncbi:MAG: VOC family protein [Pirellulales bacterium]
MSPRPKDTTATIIPCLLYRDAAAAMAWLCDVFGFEKLAAYEGKDGTIMHAELRFGNGMIMLGSGTETAYGKLIKRPEQIGGYETQAPYVIVEDADVVYQRAKAAGAEIVIDIKTEDYGGRGFTCRDLEGHLWSIGTYDPWAHK